MRLRTGVAIGVPCAYLLAVGAVTACVSQKRAAEEARVSELARMGDRVGAELRALPEDLPPLDEACRGLVDADEPSDIVSYAAPYPLELDELVKPEVGQPLVSLPRRRFEGMSRGSLERTLAADADHVPLSSVFFELLLDPPWDWSDRAERRGHRPLRMDGVRYVVVSVVRSVEPVIIVGPKTFTGGRATLLARVVEAGDGSTVCEGSLEANIASSVLARGKASGNRILDNATMSGVVAPTAVGFAFTHAIQLAPLAAVCEAGGGETCDAIERSLAPSGPQ